jgi:hypothetical protein
MKPFLSGRPIYDPNGNSLVGNTQKAAAVGGLTAVGALGSAKATQAAHALAVAHSSASVETIKQGDTVVRLVVTCACGERIEIDCLYPRKAV